MKKKAVVHSNGKFLYTPKIFWWHRFYYILLLHRQSNIIYILSLTYLDIWYYSIKSALNNFFCVEGKDTKSLMIPSATEIISLNIQSDIISSLGMDNINTLEKSLIKCQLILILKGDIDKKDRAFFWVALRGKKKHDICAKCVNGDYRGRVPLYKDYLLHLCGDYPLPL